MLRPQRLLPDPQRPLVERLRFGVLALGMIKHRQVVEAGGHVRVLRPQRLLPDPQRPLVERLGLAVASALMEVIPSLVEQPRRFSKLESKFFNKGSAGLSMRKGALAFRPSRKLYIGKSAVHGAHGALRPLPLFGFFHSVLHHRLNQPVDVERLALRIAVNQRMPPCLLQHVREVHGRLYRGEVFTATPPHPRGRFPPGSRPGQGRRKAAPGPQRRRSPLPLS